MDAAYATDRTGDPGSGLDSPIVLRSSRDLLAAVPYLLGFRPRECVVVVAVTAEGRIGLVARTALGGDGAGGGDVRVVGRASGRVGAGLAVVVLYTAAPPAAARGRATAVLEALDESLDPAVDVEVWTVGPETYRGLDCPDPACCPPGGRPVRELEHGEVGAAFVVAGRAIAPSEEDAHRISRPSVAARDRAAKAAVRAERARVASRAEHVRSPAARPGTSVRPAPDAGDGPARWRAAGYGVWRDLVRQAAREQRDGPGGAVELPPARLGRLAAALADVAVRDAVLLSLVPGAGDVADRTAGVGARDAGEDVEAATARAIARVVDPRCGVRPDGPTAAAARVVLEQLVGAAPRRWHAPPLALLGFLAWWQGDGWLAARRVREAIDRDPGYRLAALLAGVLQAAVPPGWVDARRPSGVAGVG